MYITSVAMPNLGFGSPLIGGMPFASPLQPFASPPVLPHPGAQHAPGALPSFSQLPSMIPPHAAHLTSAPNPIPSPSTSSNPTSASSSFSYPSPLSQQSSSPATFPPGHVKVQPGTFPHATGANLGHPSAGIPSHSAPLRSGHAAGVGTRAATPRSPDDGLGYSSTASVMNSSSPPSDASPAMPAGILPHPSMPGPGTMSSENQMLMSALSSLLSEIKDLKETTRELKKETLNLKNEQVLLREQFSTYITSQAANLAYLQRQQSASSSSNNSSSSSTSTSASNASNCTVLTTPQPRMPMVKGMPYIAVEGIQYVVSSKSPPHVCCLPLTYTLQRPIVRHSESEQTSRVRAAKEGAQRHLGSRQLRFLPAVPIRDGTSCNPLPCLSLLSTPIDKHRLDDATGRDRGMLMAEAGRAGRILALASSGHSFPQAIQQDLQPRAHDTTTLSHKGRHNLQVNSTSFPSHHHCLLILANLQGCDAASVLLR